ncbi:hypothetical protein [Sphingomonas panacis]|nr:hypothetical protein [Sphingomonas panacis]
MIRVSLAQDSVERLRRDPEPRRADETLYDYLVRSRHEMGVELAALRALSDAQADSLGALRRRMHNVLLGQAYVLTAAWAGVTSALPTAPAHPLRCSLMVGLVALLSGHALIAGARIAERLAGVVTAWRRT